MRTFRLLVLLLTGCFLSVCPASAQESREEPIIINGDIVEYSTAAQEATATGNVSIIYKGAKLTCERIAVNTKTKDARAEGNVRIEDKGGIIEGEKMTYNFQTKAGTIINAEFRSNPYFGRANKVEKVSEEEFVSRRGYVTTCSYDQPHYRIKSRRVNMFPGDKIQTRDDTFYLGKAPLFYLPRYNHSLKDPIMSVQLAPGKSKDWGPYLLSAWRYKLAENLSGRIYVDYREQRGVAEGFGSNYKTTEFGKGDFKFYYTQERARNFKEGDPAEFERYLIRWRHNWDIDEQTKLTSEYYKITDSKRALYGSSYNILKDYFYREYEKDTQPLSYALWHHSFDYSDLDIFLQKRVNRWYSQEEKLPEIKFTMPNFQLGNSSPFYFDNTTYYMNYNYKNAAPSSREDDTTANKFYTSNKFSLPMRIAFFQVTPSVTGQENFTDNGEYGSTSEVTLGTGAGVSTKFYRLFNTKTNLLNLDINNLRHIITPSVNYSYNNVSTMPNCKARFGGGASVGNSSVSMELSNKLQTKRKGQSVDLVDLLVTSSYNIKPKNTTKTGSSFSDFIFELKILPYSWMSINMDTTFKHTDKYAANYRKFSTINYDVSLNFAKDRILNFGQRYLRKGTNELTYELDWRLNPKWSFSIYQRRNRGHEPGIKRGLREQEYRLIRDFHCWRGEINYNVKRGEGETIWMIFRLKAFPELEFELNQSYHAPKPGSQSNP